MVILLKPSTTIYIQKSFNWTKRMQIIIAQTFWTSTSGSRMVSSQLVFSIKETISDSKSLGYRTKSATFRIRCSTPVSLPNLYVFFVLLLLAVMPYHQFKLWSHAWWNKVPAFQLWKTGYSRWSTDIRSIANMEQLERVWSNKSSII